MNRLALVAVGFFVLGAVPARADEMTLKEAKNLSPERCLQLPPDELATRCPTVAGRILEIDRGRVALLDRLDRRQGSFLCDANAGAWRCRRIVVINRELRGASKRNPNAFVTAGELLRQIAEASSVKIADEFGALSPPGLPPRSCLDLASRGCAVQAVRLRGFAPDRSGAPIVRRRLWLVEDSDGTTLQCSDAALGHCDELTAAAWSALVVTLRPSSLAPAQPPPEVDVPDVRSDKQPGPEPAGGADSAAGSLDAWLRPKGPQALPRSPSKGDVARAAHALEEAGGPCLTKESAAAALRIIFSGEGELISLASDGVPAGDPRLACLTAAAKKIRFPRFDGGTYTLGAMILPHAAVLPKARKRRR